MKETTLKNKRKNRLEFVISLFFSSAIVGGVPTMMNLAELQKYNGIDLTLMSKNFFGVPYTIKAPSEEISVAISEYFTTDEKTKIVKAVNDLDILAEGLNFNYEITDETSSKKIIINNDWCKFDTDDTTKVLAVANTTRNNMTAKIMFPAIINVNPNYNNYADLEEIMKHELLHTIGFQDVYKDNLKNETIMFWNILENADDFTQYDIETLNAIYPAKIEQNNAKSDNDKNDEQADELSL